MSAIVALGLAVQGRRVALVTIDPARRLAEALGLDALGNRPQVVDVARFGESGIEIDGELAAMMLDAKRTFDELIGLLAPTPATRDEILGNPIYEHISTAVAGSQEYAAIAKLYELEHSSDHDVIVLDTPPSRHAIDFLEAPDRLVEFLEGRALGAFLRPTGDAIQAAGVAFAALRRITGTALLDDLTSLFRLLGELLDGFHRRAADVHELLTDPASAFLIVTSPERAALEEARFPAAELDRVGMHRAGVIVNRVHPLDPTDPDVASTAARLAPVLGSSLAKPDGDHARGAPASGATGRGRHRTVAHGAARRACRLGRPIVGRAARGAAPKCSSATTLRLRIGTSHGLVARRGGSSPGTSIGCAMAMPQTQPRSASADPRSVSNLLIAAGVDGYPEGHDAAALGAMLARATGGELLLVAVHPEPLVVLPAELGWTAMREQAEEELRQTRDAFAPGARVVVETDWSVPRALERVAAREHRNLLVMGSSRRGPVGRVRIGKRTRQLLCHFRCALAVAPRGLAAAPGRRLSHVGVGYDGSEESQAALALAGSIAVAAAPACGYGAWWTTGFRASDGRASIASG